MNIKITVGLYILLSLFYAFAVLPGEGPDEIAHLIYIRSLALDGKLPEIAHTETSTLDCKSTHEGHQPPLYYALCAPVYRACGAAGMSPRNIDLVLRVFTIIISALWVFASYRLIYELTGSLNRARWGALALALLPCVSYAGGMVNNDMLESLFFTAALIPLARFVRRKETDTKGFVIFGLLTGLACLTKAQGLILPLIALCAAAFARSKKSLREFAAGIFVFLIVSAWWYIRCKIVLGTFMPQSLVNKAVEGGMIVMLFMNPVTNLLAVTSLTACTLGNFVEPLWIVQPFIGGAHRLLIPLWIGVFVLIVGAVISRKKRLFSRRMFAFAALPLVITYLSYLRYVFTVDYMAANQGRLFFPVAACMTALCLWSLEWTRNKKRTAAGVCVLFAAMNVMTMICTLMFYYN